MIPGSKLEFKLEPFLKYYIYTYYNIYVYIYKYIILEKCQLYFKSATSTCYLKKVPRAPKAIYILFVYLMSRVYFRRFHQPKSNREKAAPRSPCPGLLLHNAPNEAIYLFTHITRYGEMIACQCMLFHVHPPRQRAKNMSKQLFHIFKRINILPLFDTMKQTW